MKAILVIDMPKSCADCKLSDFGRCWGTYSYVHMRSDDIPVDCPLKPMPEPKDVHLDFDEVIWDDETFEIKKLGWNACLKEIEK